VNDDVLLVRREGRVVWLTLNRPHRMNAFDSVLIQRLHDELDGIAKDDGVSAVIIRGSGRCFSTGYDLTPPAPSEEDRARSITEDHDRILGHFKLFEKIWDLPQPVIAAVHGYCLGGATLMAVYCDLTVVTDHAIIGEPSIPVGGGYLAPVWASLIGPKRAKQMSFLPAGRFSGTTAVEWGWANYAVSQDEMWDNVGSMAAEMSRIPLEILRMKKYAINRVADLQGFRTVANIGAETDALLHFSPSVIELQQLIKDNGLKEAIRVFSRREAEPRQKK